MGRWTVPRTDGADYAVRLAELQRVWWKRLLPVQLPYQLNLRAQRLGPTLEVGCGIGRNLASLPPGSLGIDHNAKAVQIASHRGLNAMTVTEFYESSWSVEGAFDALLVSHVLEHMEQQEARALLNQYLKFIRPGGIVFIVCPQERGFASDPTHVWFASAREIERLCREASLSIRASYSFPFARPAGRLFKYNEFCVRALVPQR